MLMDCASNGGANAKCKIYANGTTEKMCILASNGNVDIGTSTPSEN